MDLTKKTLFEKTFQALTLYSDANAELELHKGIGPTWTGLRSICHTRQERFCALWDVIEAAGLVDEYEAWRQTQPTEN